jgi:transcriptional regulator with XRE-family HTH domain
VSTDFQRARAALGARLRELRTGSGLTGRDLAARLGWPQSKVSKLENGRQTPSPGELAAWAAGVGAPELAAELTGRLRGLETRDRSWRRQLAGGYRPVQEAHDRQGLLTRHRRSFDPSLIPGLLQTAGYARAVLTRYSVVHTAPRDLDAAVDARMERQRVLTDRGRTFHFLIWEAALYARPCPADVLADQLAALTSHMGDGHVRVGVIPFAAEIGLPAGPGFSLHDEHLVVSETWHAELWLDDPEDVALHHRVWQVLSAAAVHGPAAHRLVLRARAALGTPDGPRE